MKQNTRQNLARIRSLADNLISYFPNERCHPHACAARELAIYAQEILDEGKPDSAGIAQSIALDAQLRLCKAGNAISRMRERDFAKLRRMRDAREKTSDFLANSQRSIAAMPVFLAVKTLVRARECASAILEASFGSSAACDAANAYQAISFLASKIHARDSVENGDDSSARYAFGRLSCAAHRLWLDVSAAEDVVAEEEELLREIAK